MSNSSTDQPASSSDREQERGPNGKFTRTAESFARDAEALRLRGRGQTLQAVSDKLGYGGPQNVIRAIKRATQDVVGEAAETYVQQQLDLLDLLKREAMTVLERNHVAVSHGRIVYTGQPPAPGEEDTREPVLDDGPVLQAVQALLRIEERRAKLLGLDAAVKVDATVHEVTQEDVALHELINEAKAKNAAQRERIEGQL